VALSKGGRQLVAEELELTEDVRDWDLVRQVLPNLKELAVWWRGVPSLEVIQEYAKSGVKRLVLRRTWNAPRGPEQDAEFAQLLKKLETTKLPFAQLGLMPAWNGGRRPEPIELVPTERGMAPLPAAQGEGAKGHSSSAR
jgi:hypothetical protein